MQKRGEPTPQFFSLALPGAPCARKKLPLGQGARPLDPRNFYNVAVMDLDNCYPIAVKKEGALPPPPRGGSPGISRTQKLS